MEDGILFRRWSSIHFYKKPSVNIIDIIDNQDRILIDNAVDESNINDSHDIFNSHYYNPIK